LREFWKVTFHVGEGILRDLKLTRARKSAMEAEAAEAASQRTTLSAQVPAEALRVYERIRAGNKRSGTAVAVVHGEYCQGCQMAITSHELTELIKGDKICICRTCQRILVLET
jgi:predicted  nucleic acid-binding Zn-ribbon protein